MDQSEGRPTGGREPPSASTAPSSPVSTAPKRAAHEAVLTLPVVQARQEAEHVSADQEEFQSGAWASSDEVPVLSATTSIQRVDLTRNLESARKKGLSHLKPLGRNQIGLLAG
jgi:hypothetical protein